MADDSLTVVVADGTTVPLRSIDVGSGKQAQATMIAELAELPVAPDSAPQVRYSVTDAAAVPLAPPAAGARYARLRVYRSGADGSANDGIKRMYYRTDGTAPSNTGANVFGFAIHTDVIYVKLATFANFKMIAESGQTFEVYCEWLTLPTPA